MSGDDLLEAARNGDLDKVISLLDQGVNINHKSQYVSIKNKNREFKIISSNPRESSLFMIEII